MSFKHHEDSCPLTLQCIVQTFLAHDAQSHKELACIISEDETWSEMAYYEGAAFALHGKP